MIPNSPDDLRPDNPEAQGETLAALNPRTVIEVTSPGTATTNDPVAADRRPVGGTPPSEP